MSFDLTKYIKERCELIDGRLKMAMPREDEFPLSLHRSMRYSTFAGGKRIRPLLLLAACEAVGGDVSSGSACCLRFGDDSYLFAYPR